MNDTLRLPMAAAAVLIAAGGGLGGGFYPDDTGWRRPLPHPREQKKYNPNATKQAAAKRARKITRRRNHG